MGYRGNGNLGQAVPPGKVSISTIRFVTSAIMVIFAEDSSLIIFNS